MDRKGHRPGAQDETPAKRPEKHLLLQGEEVLFRDMRRGRVKGENDTLCRKGKNKLPERVPVDRLENRGVVGDG